MKKVCEFEMCVPKSQINNVIYEIKKYVESYDGTVKHLVYENKIYFKIKVEDKYAYALNSLIKQLNDYINQINVAQYVSSFKDADFFSKLWICVSACGIIAIIVIAVIKSL